MDEVTELSLDECRALLRGDVVGRVAFTTPHGPRIVPVNYTVQDGVLEIRTTSYSELATNAPGATVAFEIDHLDRELRSGWSVVVLGLCERALDPSAAVFDPPVDLPAPWAGGNRPLLLRITAQDVTGRRVGAEDWAHPTVADVPGA